ncbi:MAG: NAD-glutamate dehydrogenase [Inquilinaceae bacterium]
MAHKAEQQKGDLIDAVVALVRDRFPKKKANLAERFVRLYYRNVPPNDIARQDVEDLYGAAMGLWQTSAARQRNTPKVRVYNPRYDAHGWHSSHTVVEIVNDDMPFLVDSVTSALNQANTTVHLIIHPVLSVTRDAEGQLVAAAEPGPDAEGQAESYMHLEIDEQTSPDALSQIETMLIDVLADVRAAVDDWPKMRSTLHGVLEGLRTNPPPSPPEETAELAAFLSWMDEDHFTFLGFREYGFHEDSGQTDMGVVAGSGLGLLRDDDVSVFDGMRHFANLPPDVQNFIRQPRLLMVTKSNRRSTVHRPVHLDTVILKAFDAEGQVTGERIFVGLLTSVAYNRSARDIPYLRQKVSRILAEVGFDPRSHDGKALTHILDTFPRDELFQAADDELRAIAMGVLHLQDRQRTALFVRQDPYERFVSALVYVPRDRYNTDLRRRFAAILEKALGGAVTAFYTQLTEGVHARIQFIVRTTPGAIPAYESDDIERELIDAGRSWADWLQEVLIEARGEEQGLTLMRRYGEAFPTNYCESTVPQAAILDIERVEEALADGDIALNFYRPLEAADHQARFKLYHPAAPVPLSDVLPMLEHMGLKVMAESPYEVSLASDGDAADTVWIHDFDVQHQDGAAIDVGRIKTVFQEAFARVWRGEMEDDGFNRMVLGAALTWREVTVLRAYGKYLRQAQFAFSQDYIEDALAAHPTIARLVVDLFVALFDPGVVRQDRQTAEIENALVEALDKVANLDEDRILRRYLNLIQSTLRTNFYQSGADGQPKSYLSLKLDSQAVEGLPLPRPWREIFVYSPRMEAVHLRGGPVARGGIRWSDRREDFRTEVLGLMKAQMVKNAVIVPVGSKGGFVLKRPPREGGREALRAEGVACYQTMMRGLLDLTDNFVAGAVVPPPDVVRRDPDDPYLVVAADKGTATFSDIANGISADYGFWLRDAFASGGSAGYDHKVMGITARGAWEGVKRHFRELGRDIQTQDFTVVGVGDMSGDVFGNGMLLSEHIRLVAAFNHLHIFIDPDPDIAASFRERQRLFKLASGSWDQYDAGLISPGGGVFDRKAKAIDLTPEIRTLLGVDDKAMTPAALIHALLQVPADLLWFGGIGTYVKAASETHADVGDKANDALRVDGRQVRALVIGEGANLGVTQRGRIEYARSGGQPEATGGGGRLNTDFIDNSAGVDCSDHEVNIKILLNSVIDSGDMTLKQRNALLERMTDEVAALVLRDNYLQTQALSTAMAERQELLDQQARYMRVLEKGGLLNRAIEYLPDDEELTERLGRREGLFRPELSVLLSYAKITLYDQVLASDLPDDPALAGELTLYFPEPLGEAHDAAIREHRLRREIIATHVTNSVINRTGPTFVAETEDITGLGTNDIVRAFIIVRESFGLRALWSEIQALDTKVPAETQIRMFLIIRRLIERTTAWVLRHHGEDLDIGRHVARLKPGIELLYGSVDELLYESASAVLEERIDRMTQQGVPAPLARSIASLNLVAAGCDLIRIAELCGLELRAVAPAYYDLGRRLGIAWLRDRALTMPAGNHWQKHAVGAIIDDLYALQADLTVNALGQPGNADVEAAMAAWLERRRQPVERIDQLMAELRALETVELSMLAVANRRLRGLITG